MTTPGAQPVRAPLVHDGLGYALRSIYLARTADTPAALGDLLEKLDRV